MRRIAPVTVLLVLLAGCAPTPSAPTAAPTPPVAESQTPTPTPVAIQQPETGLVQPAQVFGGDCDSIFSINELTDILGSSAMPTGVPENTGDASVFLTAQSGGLTCSWASSDYANGIVITVVPAALLPLTTAEACAKDPYDSAGVECAMEAESNETRLSGKVWFAKAGARNKTKTAKLVSIFDEKAAATEPVPLPIANADSWSNPVECSILEPLLDNPTMLGGTGDLQIYQGNGSDVYFTPAEHVLYGFDDKADQVACAFTTADPNRELTKAEIKAGKISEISFSLVGGAAWVEDELSGWDGAKKISIDGIDSAYLVTNGDESGTFECVVVFDGPNMLSASTAVGGAKKTFASIALVVEALNADR